MVRRFAEIVHVGLAQTGPTQADPARTGLAQTGLVQVGSGRFDTDVVPAAFQWRQHRYVVREVLGHWRERRAWWTGALAQAARSGEPSAAEGDAGVGGVASVVGALGEEYEVWRVEASRPGFASVGVYDLCHDPGSQPATAAWRLLRVVD